MHHDWLTLFFSCCSLLPPFAVSIKLLKPFLKSKPQVHLFWIWGNSLWGLKEENIDVCSIGPLALLCQSKYYFSVTVQVILTEEETPWSMQYAFLLEMCITCNCIALRPSKVQYFSLLFWNAFPLLPNL